MVCYLPRPKPSRVLELPHGHAQGLVMPKLIYICISLGGHELLAWLGIEDLDHFLKERRLCWYGHAECSNGAVKIAFDIQDDGKRGPGRPR